MVPYQKLEDYKNNDVLKENVLKNPIDLVK